MSRVPLFFLDGWHRYNWPNYGPTYQPAVFQNFTVSGVDKDACVVSIALAKGGIWSAIFGYGGGAPAGKTPDRVVAATVGDSVNVTGLKPNTLYFITVVAYIQDPNPNGLPLSGIYYDDPQTFTTLNVPPPPLADADLNVLFPEEVTA
jgi:hypothetical protein